MNGPPWTGSSPSTYPRSTACGWLNIGTGTNACRARGIPFALATESTSRANTFTCTATVGIRYSDSIAIMWPETSGAQPGQVPTPMIAASPSAAIFP